jgi:hypothetical protein
MPDERDDQPPPGTNDSDVTEEQFTEIERWVRKRVQRRLAEWEKRDPSASEQR